jgi:hypothetical protein
MDQDRRESLRISISLPFEWQRFDHLPDQVELEDSFGLNRKFSVDKQARLQSISEGLGHCGNSLPPEMRQVIQLLDEKIDILFESLVFPMPPQVETINLSHEGISFLLATTEECDQMGVGDHIGVHLVLACGHLLCAGKIANLAGQSVGLHFDLLPTQQRMLSKYLLGQTLKR